MSQLKVNTIRHTGASSDAVTLATDGTCTAKITNNLGNKNLVVNGSCLISQRGVSSTTNGYGTVDRMKCTFRADADEACTQQQVDVASGTTPYNLGFRKAVKQTNGNQTSGAQAASYAQIIYAIEAQDIATSGWNYTSASSYITISFWAKASVSQTYNLHLESSDGTAQLYSHSYALSANTWTKVTTTIPGNSNITINNDNGPGLYIVLDQYLGTQYTTSGHTSNTWAAAGSWNDMGPDMTTTWWTTNDATFEMTGLQLEVGDVATDFEHRSYGDELARCQRYYFIMNSDDGDASMFGLGWASATNYFQNFVRFPVSMRDTPSALEQTGTASNYRVNWSGGNSNCTTAPTFATATKYSSSFYVQATGLTTNMGGFLRSNDNSAYIAWSAEL